MKKFSITILIIINVAIVIGLWATGWCGTMNPNTFGWLSLIGYAFPVFLVATVAFFLVWIIIKKRYILISFIGLLIAYNPVTLYFPINRTTASDELPDSLITLLSYNTCSWGKMPTSPDNVNDTEDKHKIIYEFLKEQNADILAIQEYEVNSEMQPLFDFYEYIDTVNNKKNDLIIALLSHYPIKKKKNLNIDSKSNIAAAFWLDVKGREVIVINVHLETMHFTVKDRTKFSEMVHGKNKEKEYISSTSHTIFGKIYSATKRRANQADTIAEFIKEHKDTPIIVMGDFNDIPHSYVYNKINGDLVNCYSEAGFGPGYTYSNYGMRVRIDNIICSHHFTPYNCKVIDTIKVSDHFPITCKVKL